MKLLESDSGGRLVCDYCGYETVPIRERTPEEQAQIHERSRERVRKKAEEKAKRRSRIIVTVVLAAAAALVIAGIIIRYTARLTIDPFNYVTVTFSGGNGKGEAKLNLHSNDRVDASQIRYVLSQSYGLSEGDEIRVEAESDVYQLTKKRETYTVEGLDPYVTSLTALSDEALSVIHAKSEEVSLRNRERSEEIVHDCVYYKPVMMYLLTDGANRNLLYDVYEAGFSMENDDVYYVYLVTYYENIIVRDEEPVTIDYGRCFYDGNTITFGESMFNQSTLRGYETLEEIEEDLTANQDTNMKLRELVTDPDAEEE